MKRLILPPDSNRLIVPVNRSIQNHEDPNKVENPGRREFLGLLGATAGLLLLESCGIQTRITEPPIDRERNTLDLSEYIGDGRRHTGIPMVESGKAFSIEANHEDVPLLGTPAVTVRNTEGRLQKTLQDNLVRVSGNVAYDPVSGDITGVMSASMTLSFTTQIEKETTPGSKFHAGTPVHLPAKREPKLVYVSTPPVARDAGMIYLADMPLNRDVGGGVARGTWRNSPVKIDVYAKVEGTEHVDTFFKDYWTAIIDYGVIYGTGSPHRLSSLTQPITEHSTRAHVFPAGSQEYEGGMTNLETHVHNIWNGAARTMMFVNTFKAYDGGEADGTGRYAPPDAFAETQLGRGVKVSRGMLSNNRVGSLTLSGDSANYDGREQYPFGPDLALWFIKNPYTSDPNALLLVISTPG